MEFVCKILYSQGSRIAARGAGALPAITQHATFSTRSPSKLQGNLNKRTELDYEELSNLMCFTDIALIDVRTPTEIMNYGSIPGAVNIPLSEIKNALQLPEEEFEGQFFLQKPSKKDRNLIFFARGPNASSAAVEIAHRLGYTGSRQYTGGWEDYCQRTGVPLKKSERQEMSSFMNAYGQSNFKRFAV